MKEIFMLLVICVVISCSIVHNAEVIDSFDFIEYFSSQWWGK